MTALERKHNTEKILEELGIVLKGILPPLEEEAEVRLRSPHEIASRIVILTHLSCAAEQEYLREQIIDYLKTEDLWESTSEQEKTIFTKTTLTEDDKTIVSWRLEAIWFLMWVTNRIDKIDLPTEGANIEQLFRLLPGFMVSKHEFVTTTTIRSVSEIMDQADLNFRLQWASTEIDLSSMHGLNPGVLYERYHTASWVAGMQEWP